MNTADIKDVVKEKYGQAALRVNRGGSPCCGATAASGLGCDPITSNLYDSSQAGQVPKEAMLASLGCAKSAQKSATACFCGSAVWREHSEMTSIATNYPQPVLSKSISSRHGSIAPRMRVSFFPRPASMQPRLLPRSMASS